MSPTASEQHTDLGSLRGRLAELETENAQLKGRGPASRGNVAMIRRNTELRRQVESLRQKLPAADMADRDGYLTIHQVASRLNTTAGDASELLTGVETRFDANGVEVVATDTFEQFLVDTVAGRNPSRFL